MRNKFWVIFSVLVFIGGTFAISMWPGSLNYKLYFNTRGIKLEEEVKGEICDVVNTRGARRIFLCNKKNGYFLSVDENTSDSIGRFIDMGRTIMKKASGDSVLYFEHIDTVDTVIVSFGIDYPDEFLHEGVWIGRTKETILE